LKLTHSKRQCCGLVAGVYEGESQCAKLIALSSFEVVDVCGGSQNAKGNSMRTCMTRLILWI
jgi:hypothetical protein